MKKIISKPLKTKRLSEIVENNIKNIIISGEIKVGERLPTEKEISEQFGVSSVTVREALKALEAIGLIEKRKGRGGRIFVSHVKEKNVKIPLYNLLQSKDVTTRHLAEMRLILEPAVVKKAISEITLNEIKDLEKNIRYCKKKIENITGTFNKKDFLVIEEKNVEFHRLIAGATHNPILAITVYYVMDFLLNYKKKKLVPDIEFTKKTIMDHQTILNHIKKRDGKNAAKDMITHLDYVKKYFSIHTSMDQGKTAQDPKFIEQFSLK